MLNVLLIEDDPDYGHLIELWLDQAGYAVERVPRLAAAVPRLGRGGIEAVLVDLALPDSSGLDTFAAVQAAAPQLPVVVLTGNACEDLADRAVQLGAQDYLLKDELDRRTLARSLRYALERHRAARALEEQRQRLLHAAKMAALGEMSAAICHEVNNPLMVIRGQAQLLQGALRRGPLDHELAEDMLSRIVRMTARVADITTALRGFARQTADDPMEATPVMTLVHDALELCGERFRAAGIELAADPVPPALVIDCLPTEITRLLVNLLNNAFDAVTAPEARARRVRVEVEDAGRSVVLRVVDGGVGVAPRAREQLMTPFFTTKPRGKGLGLGLYLSAGIAQKHGGNLVLEPGRRETSFALTVPKRVAAVAASAGVPAHAPESESPR